MTAINGLNIVFLHGWGMNQGIWTGFIRYSDSRLPSHTVLRAIDLPGYGQNFNVDIYAYTVPAIAQAVAKQLSPNTILVGWSMGGLVAQQIVNSGNRNILAHIQIASTPKFVQAESWQGIKPEILNMFSKQLQTDHNALLKRFLGIQCLGLDKPNDHARSMLNAICKYPLSSVSTLSKSLQLLTDTDLRPASTSSTSENAPCLRPPCLRLYGGLDTLVSPNVISAIQTLYPKDKNIIIPKASHAPFLSHPKETFEVIDDFIKSILGQSRNQFLDSPEHNI